MTGRSVTTPPQQAFVNVAKSRFEYRILGRIASGGMGAVYMASSVNDPSLSRLVAVKIIHEHLAENRVFVNMLLDEAQVAQRIVHPNVVNIIDVGEFDGRHFVVMPYIEGGTLSELVRAHGARLPYDIAAYVVIDALNGLHAAHALVDHQGKPMGLVHRDVSPGNILIGTDGVARMIDFGVAKAAARITHTAPGTVKGKFSYMAPEQAMGEPLDHRADIFSMGVVLWTVLTGRRLFTGSSSAHTIRNLISADIPPPSKLRPHIPACLDDVCMRALQRDRSERFQSAAEMAEALYTALIIADRKVSSAELGRIVYDSFAKRINRRRDVVGELRQDLRNSSSDLNPRRRFPLEVRDIDRSDALDSISQHTPSAYAQGSGQEFGDGFPITGDASARSSLKGLDDPSSELSVGRHARYSASELSEDIHRPSSQKSLPRSGAGVASRQTRPRRGAMYLILGLVVVVAVLGLAVAARSNVVSVLFGPAEIDSAAKHTPADVSADPATASSATPSREVGRDEHPEDVDPEDVDPAAGPGQVSGLGLDSNAEGRAQPSTVDAVVEPLIIPVPKTDIPGASLANEQDGDQAQADDGAAGATAAGVEAEPVENGGRSDVGDGDGSAAEVAASEPDGDDSAAEVAAGEPRGDAAGPGVRAKNVREQKRRQAQQGNRNKERNSKRAREQRKRNKRPVKNKPEKPKPDLELEENPYLDK